MAGNVKECCWNATGNRRYILGGAWNEPAYTFSEPDALSPFDRPSVNGFRCVRYLSGVVPEPLTLPVEKPIHDYHMEKPVSDSVFRIYRSLYSYDRTDLKPTIESVDETPRFWRREVVTFNAAYGNERVIAWLFLPKNAARPYQAVVFFPSTLALTEQKIGGAELKIADFLIKSGRALMYPVYKGTYERRSAAVATPGSITERDLTIQQYKDFERSLDYLETRPTLPMTDWATTESVRAVGWDRLRWPKRPESRQPCFGWRIERPEASTRGGSLQFLAPGEDAGANDQRSQ